MALASAWVLSGGLGGGSLLIWVVGLPGLLFFGGAMVGFVAALFDRRVKVSVSPEGLVVYPHSPKPIGLRSIKRIGTQQSLVRIILHKPSKYPVQGRWRKALVAISSSIQRANGDVWMFCQLYDCTAEQMVDAIWDARPRTKFEQEIDAIVASWDENGGPYGDAANG